MKLDIKIEGNIPDYLARKALFYPKATASALNKMAAQVKTKASTLVRAEITASKQSVDKTFQIRTATPDRLQSALIATGRNINVIAFGAKESSTRYEGGVMLSIPTTAVPGGFIPHAFIARMPSGKVGVFRRDDKAIHKKVGKGKWSPALPIVAVTAGSIPTMIKSPKISAQLLTFIRDNLTRLVNHEIEFWGR